MNKMSNKIAYQTFFDNAPELSESPQPEVDPKSNGNAGLLISLAVVVIGQLVMLAALDKFRKDMLGKINNTPKSPKISQKGNSTSLKSKSDI
jgi:hypothetical protein